MRSALRWAFVAVLAVHGALHLAPRPAGVAGLLLLGAAVATAARVRLWWVAVAVAALASAAALVAAGTWWPGVALDAVLLLVAGYGYLSTGPRSLRAEFRARRAALPDPPPGRAPVAEADLAELPDPLASYVRRGGAVGQPRVAGFHAAIHGRIRSGPSAPWMAFTGEQVNTCGPQYDRLFFIDATRSGLPVDVLHVFTGRSATMRAKACSVVPVLDAAGPGLDRAETVTIFNDLCVLAPAALVDAPVAWQRLDGHRVRGTFTRGDHTVSAELIFDDRHDLVDFVSDDRLRAEPDGHTFTRQRWSTPVREYRWFGPRRIAAAGAGRWYAPDPFTYVDFHVDDIADRTAAGDERR